MTNVDKDPVIEMCRAIEDYFGDADRTFPEAIALLVAAARERDHLVTKDQAISRSEQVLRTAIMDLMCSCPPDDVGGRLRQALGDSRDPGEHPENRCEECRELFEHWFAPTEDWARVTGRGWGGPIVCRPCFDRRLASAGPIPDLTTEHLDPPDGYFIRGDMTKGWSVALTARGPNVYEHRRAAVSEAHAHSVRGARLEQEREEQRTKRLYGLLDVMVQRWPKGSTDDIKDLARILGVELWARTLPSPGSGEMRWSTADAGKAFDQTDTDGWTQVEVGQ